MLIGLTGSSGSGKSTVASVLAGHGFNIVDCDRISKEIDSDASYRSRIKELFPEACQNGNIDRKALGRTVFNDAEKLALLVSVSHPVIIERSMAEVKAAEEKGLDSVLDAPLLFESGLDKKCGYLIGVVSDKAKRIERLIKRDGISPALAGKMTELQRSEDFLRGNCDAVIENDGTLEELIADVGKVLLSVYERKALLSSRK